MPMIGMYRRQTPTTLPQQLPGHPGYQASAGPMVTTLPQRAGMPVQGGHMPPVATGRIAPGSWGNVNQGYDFDGYPLSGAARSMMNDFVTNVAPKMMQPQPIWQTLPERPGNRPQGPLSIPASMTQRGANAPVQGPVQLGGVPNRPFGMTMPTGYSAVTRSMLGGPNNTPTVAPGSGNVIYRDGEYNPTTRNRRADEAGVARDQMYGAADPAGPYSGTAGMRHFGPLASHQPNTMQAPAANWQQGHSDAADASQRRARGLTAAYADTIGTPNSANLAYAARADDRAAGLREGRRNRAIQKYGLTHLQPTNNYTYDSNIGVAGGYTRSASQFGAPPSRGVADLVARNTPVGEDGSRGQTNWSGVARSIYTDPTFRSNPRAAFDELRKAGMNTADIQALVDEASGQGLFNLQDSDPNYTAWLDGLRAAAGLQGPAQPPGYAPVGPLGTPSVVGRGGQYAPPLPRGTPVVQPPFGSAAPPSASHGEGPVGIPDLTMPWARTAPPPTPPRRRPGPAFRPDF